MLKVLIKKQIAESFSFLYYDSKRGVRRSKKQNLMYWPLFVLVFGFIDLIFLLLGGKIAEVAFPLGLHWLYWMFMSMFSILLGIFGSVFNTFQTVYLAGDNEMMLALPIKKQELLIARLSSVYAMGLFYMLQIYLPAMIVAIAYGQHSVKSIVAQLIMMVVLSVIVLALSALLGWGVASISIRLHNKSFVTVFVSLIFMAAYYAFYAFFMNQMQEFIKNMALLARQVEDSAAMLVWIGNACCGDPLALVEQIAIAAISLLVVYVLLVKNFTKLLMMRKGEKKVVGKKADVKVRSVSHTLFQKELLRFTKSANYMLNCALGTVFLVVAGVAMVLKKSMIQEMMQELPIGKELYTALVIAMVCFMATTNYITTPSVSMEGKNLWILQTLPVSGWDILKQKIKLHIVVTLPAVWILCICVEYAMELSPVLFGMLIFLSTLFVVFTAVEGMVMGVKAPNLKWTNESVALKQSFGSFAILFGNWILVGLLCFFCYLTRNMLKIDEYLVIISIVLCVLIGICIRWLQTRGGRILEKL